MIEEDFMRQVSNAEANAIRLLTQIRDIAIQRRDYLMTERRKSRERRSGQIGAGVIPSGPKALSNYLKDLSEVASESELTDMIRSCDETISAMNKFVAEIKNRDLAEDEVWRFPDHPAHSLSAFDEALSNAQDLMSGMRAEQESHLELVGFLADPHKSALQMRIDNLEGHIQRLRPQLDRLEELHAKTGRP
jgi:hypothetical protein